MISTAARTCSAFRLALLLLVGVLAPGLAWASLPSSADLVIGRDVRALPDLPSRLQTPALEQRAQLACVAFCEPAPHLELEASTLKGRVPDAWPRFDLGESERPGRVLFGTEWGTWLVYYANDNPTRYVDPTGHFSWEAFKEGVKSLPRAIAEPVFWVYDTTLAVGARAMDIPTEHLPLQSALAKRQLARLEEGQSGTATALKGAVETPLAVFSAGTTAFAQGQYEAYQDFSNGKISVDEYDRRLSQMAGGQTAGAALGMGLSRASGRTWTGRSQAGAEPVTVQEPVTQVKTTAPAGFDSLEAYQAEWAKLAVQERTAAIRTQLGESAGRGETYGVEVVRMPESGKAHVVVSHASAYGLPKKVSLLPGEELVGRRTVGLDAEGKLAAWNAATGAEQLAVGATQRICAYCQLTYPDAPFVTPRQPFSLDPSGMPNVRRPPPAWFRLPPLEEAQDAALRSQAR